MLVGMNRSHACRVDIDGNGVRVCRTHGERDVNEPFVRELSVIRVREYYHSVRDTLGSAHTAITVAMPVLSSIPGMNTTNP